MQLPIFPNLEAHKLKLRLLAVSFLVISLVTVVINVSDPLKQQVTSVLAGAGGKVKTGAQQKIDDARSSFQKYVDSQIRQRERETQGGCKGAGCTLETLIQNPGKFGTQNGKITKPSAQQLAEQKLIDNYNSAKAGNQKSLDTLKSQNAALAKQVQTALTAQKKATTAVVNTIFAPVATANGQCGIGMTAEDTVCRNNKTGQIIDYKNIVLYQVAIGHADPGGQVKLLCQAEGASGCDTAAGLKDYATNNLPTTTQKTAHDLYTQENASTVLDAQRNTELAQAAAKAAATAAAKAAEAAKKAEALKQSQQTNPSFQQQKVTAPPPQQQAQPLTGGGTTTQTGGSQVVTGGSSAGTGTTVTSGTSQGTANQPGTTTQTGGSHVITGGSSVGTGLSGTTTTTVTSGTQSLVSQISNTITNPNQNLLQKSVTIFSFIRNSINTAAAPVIASNQSPFQKILSIPSIVRNILNPPKVNITPQVATPSENQSSTDKTASGFGQILKQPVPDTSKSQSNAPAANAPSVNSPNPVLASDLKVLGSGQGLCDKGYCDGKRMYELYQFLAEQKNQWYNSDGNFTPNRFLAMIIMGEALGSGHASSETVAKITEAVSNQLGNPELGHPAYCTTVDCEGGAGMLNLLGAYSQSAWNRYNTMLDYNQNFSAKTLKGLTDQQLADYFAKNGISLDQIASKITVNKPSDPLNSPTDWGCLGCGDASSLDKWVQTARDHNAPIGTTSPNGIYYMGKDGEVVYTRNQAAYWCARSPGGCK